MTFLWAFDNEFFYKSPKADGNMSFSEGKKHRVGVVDIITFLFFNPLPPFWFHEGDAIPEDVFCNHYSQAGIRKVIEESS